MSMGFPRQEYWSGLPSWKDPGDLPDPGIEPISPALASKFFTTKPPGKPKNLFKVQLKRRNNHALNFVPQDGGTAAAKSLQSCLTLHDHMDCSLPCSSVHGIFQARALEWAAIAFSGDSLHQVLTVPLYMIQASSFQEMERGMFGKDELGRSLW